MYLSRIDMNLSSPAVRAALRDAQRMHRLAAGFYGVSRGEAQLLYRCRVRGTAVSLYMFSAVPVDRSRIPSGMILGGEREMTDWLAGFREGQCMQFDLLTMPFKKTSGAEGGNSRRRVLRTQEERLSWLARKAAQHGFRVLRAEEGQEEQISAVHPKERGGNLYLDAYRYTGVLQIEDGDAFRAAVQTGIGPGRSYGLGMLLLKG